MLSRGVRRRSVNINIQRAECCDASELTAIAFAAKRYWGYPEEWIELWADELTVDANYIATNWVFLAKADSRTVGWCSVSRERGEIWLDYCWVLPEESGNGIGRTLVRRALDLAAELKSPALKVISDPNAEDFYRKLGFHPVGDHPSVPQGRRLPVLEANVADAA